jgi:hypothetical protein
VIRFDPIRLPATYRRSFIAGQLGLRCHTFNVLLAILAPDHYLALKDHNPFTVYTALFRHCETLFPIYEPEWFADEYVEDELLYVMEESGIPVRPYGVEDWDLEFGPSPALSVVSYLLEQPEQRVAVNRLDGGAGRAFKKLWTLEPFLTKQIDPKMINPPRGRKWSGRWAQIPMLVKYIQHDTRYQWLDVSVSECDEEYNPPWTLDDIRFLARDWAKTAPVWKALHGFITWLDGAPGSRLPWLLLALTGDEKTRMKLSEPKRENGRTLAEVFIEQEERASTHTRDRAR